MLMPKKVKHRKMFKGRRRMKGDSHRGCMITFGTFALKCLATKWVTSRQIEAARRAIIRYLKKGGKLWIRVFPDKPITQKGGEVGMGGGKGGVDHYVVAMKPGRIIFELAGVKEEVAKKAFRAAADKLPIKTKFIQREV
ncbi:MAG: 50S ribosomal protein L16 [Patescibacteria group bacterium]|nr:50S ribosomal protein L16 [Patescibacteria group bacterium]MBU1876963.1 50S ribosomal protein L16 [Patescibacteria group bacterium]